MPIELAQVQSQRELQSRSLLTEKKYTYYAVTEAINLYNHSHCRFWHFHMHTGRHNLVNFSFAHNRPMKFQKYIYCIVVKCDECLTIQCTSLVLLSRLLFQKSKQHHENQFAQRARKTLVKTMLDVLKHDLMILSSRRKQVNCSDITFPAGKGQLPYCLCAVNIKMLPQNTGHQYL